ncbi:MAG: MFS transporter, partial [Deltaproteobacteria bacterium]|nr:MFS transporter [Deltaproteobacteria bacterium]
TALLVVPPAWFIIAAKSGHAEQSPKADGKATDWTVKEALTSLSFWLLFSSRVLASMGNQIVITHQIAHAVDVGFSKIFAASIFGLMGVVSVFGRVLFGSLADRMRGESVFTLVQIVSTLGIISLMMVQDRSLPALLYSYALFYGLGQGSRALVLSTISADLFLGKSFGAIYGYFTMSIGVGGAFGAWLGGYIHDTTNSYYIAFLVAILCFVASTVNVWQVRRKPKTVSET